MDQVLHLKKSYILRKERIHHRGVKGNNGIES